MSKKNILVTGGAGYIGSTITLALAAANFQPVVIDDLSTGRRGMVPIDVAFVQGDCGDDALVRDTMRKYHIDGVIHCAGKIQPNESMRDPLKYYHGNTGVSRNLISACVAENVNAFLFSSTSAVYGNPENLPVCEGDATIPVSPYGKSKLMTEQILADVAHAHPLKYVAMRYFNVAGCDPDLRCGQVMPEVIHLIRRALRVYLGEYETLELFGTDYATKDGTCVRDYIHVSDLATAHVLAMQYLLNGGDSRVMNCGYGHGFSVREVIKAIEGVTSKTLSVTESPRRDGDPAEIIANSDFLKNTLGWTPKYDDINIMIRHALAWEERERAGKKVAV